MPLRSPPPGFPVRTFPSPKITDQVLIEWVNNELGDYTPLEPGAAHPNQREFSGFKLGIQRQNPVDHNFIQRIWVTDETSPDAYNYALKYSAEAITAPIFIRTYREPKTSYTPRAKASALGSIYKLILDEDNQGSGYANDTRPTVTFDVSIVEPTSVAIGHGVVSPDGTIAECILDFCGEGYTQNVAFTVEAPVNGSPASGLAYVQPIAAVLVKEEANEYPPESEFYADYFQVTRVYETLPGPEITSTVFERDGIVKTETKQRVLAGTVVVSEELFGGTLTRTFEEAVDTVVSNQTTEVITVDSNSLLDQPAFTVSIPEGIIPLEFRASITTTIVSHILPGTAIMPTLAIGEFEHSKRQLHPLYYEERITKLSSIAFPIIQHGEETSSEFGGAILDVERTLDDSVLTASEGEDIVTSYVNPIGNNLMWFRETKKRPGTDVAWPIVSSRLWDENLRVEYDETSQVLVAGTSEDPDPGGAVFGWVSEAKGLDKWKSRKVNTSKPTPTFVNFASALISYEYKPFKFPGLIYQVVGYYVRRASAQLCRQTIRTWWEKSATTPVITVDEIFLDQIIISSLNDITRLEYADDVLHDDLTTFGILFYPATTPSYTDYVGSWLGNEKIVAASVTPEREKNVWRCQTRSVVMR